MARKKAAPKPVKRVKTSALNLTLEELIHLRDLFNVRFPSTTMGGLTVSQSLAKIEDREIIETRLWDKLTKLLVPSGIPIGDDAPDHVIAMTAPPELGVFPVEVREDFVEEEDDGDDPGYLEYRGDRDDDVLDTATGPAR